MWKGTKTEREAAPGLAMPRAGGVVKTGPFRPGARRGLDCAPRPGGTVGREWSGRLGAGSLRDGHGGAVAGLCGSGVWVDTCPGLQSYTGAKKATAWVAFVVRSEG